MYSGRKAFENLTTGDFVYRFEKYHAEKLYEHPAILSFWIYLFKAFVNYKNVFNLINGNKINSLPVLGVYNRSF